MAIEPDRKGRWRKTGVVTDQEDIASPAVRSVYPPIVWLTFCAGFVAWSYDLDSVSRAAPLLVGYAGLVLGALDLVSRFEGRAPNAVRITMGAGFSHPEITHNSKLSAELVQVGWMTLFVVMLLFIGVLPAVPVYVLASMRINGRRTWKESVIASVATLAFVFVVFEVLLAFELYRGVLFDERGFDRW